MPRTALLLIAHGSRQPDANADLLHLANGLRIRGHDIVEPAYLELAEPGIDEAGKRCMEQGAECVILVPYFLSAGIHVERDFARRVTLWPIAIPPSLFAWRSRSDGIPCCWKWWKRECEWRNIARSRARSKRPFLGAAACAALGAPCSANKCSAAHQNVRANAKTCSASRT